MIHPNELIQWHDPVLNDDDKKYNYHYEAAHNYQLAQTFAKYINPKWIKLIIRLWFATLSKSWYIYIKAWAKSEDVLNQKWLESFVVIEDGDNININPYTNGLLIKDKNGNWKKSFSLEGIYNSIVWQIKKIFLS